MVRCNGAFKPRKGTTVDCEIIFRYYHGKTLVETIPFKAFEKVPYSEALEIAFHHLPELKGYDLFESTGIKKTQATIELLRILAEIEQRIPLPSGINKLRSIVSNRKPRNVKLGCKKSVLIQEDSFHSIMKEFEDKDVILKDGQKSRRKLNPKKLPKKGNRIDYETLIALCRSYEGIKPLSVRNSEERIKQEWVDNLTKG